MQGPEIEQIFICDYATADIEGKVVLGGIYGDEIVFAADAPVWPPLRFFVILRPIVKKIYFTLSFKDPTYKEVFGVSGTFEAKTDVEYHNTVNMNIHMPPRPLEVGGDYQILFTANGTEIYRRRIIVRKGTAPKRFDAEVNAKAHDFKP